MGHKAQTHCVNGHEFTAENTYLDKRSSGRQSRRCRTCTLAATKLHDTYKRKSSKRGRNHNGENSDREYRSRLRIFLGLDNWWRPLDAGGERIDG
jgi:hypothetical protein